MQSNNFKKIFISGHCEYDRDTLYEEYIRDRDKNKPIDIPRNYFEEDNLNKKTYNEMALSWRSLIFKLDTVDRKTIK